MTVIAGLPDTSLTSAMSAGGRQFYGWGVERYMMAEIYDALNLNTQATGQWKSKPPKFKEFPRPQMKKPEGEQEKKKKVTIRDLYQGSMNRQKREG